MLYVFDLELHAKFDGRFYFFFLRSSLHTQYAAVGTFNDLLTFLFLIIYSQFGFTRARFLYVLYVWRDRVMN